MAKNDGLKMAIDGGIIARALGALRGMKDGWFGPGEPLPPVVQPEQREQVLGRQFDFRVAGNKNLTPRNEEAVSFAQLRGLADSCDVLRIIIERRKDQLARLNWQIVPKDDSVDPDDRCKLLTKFFNLPDGEHDWDTWLRMLIEDLIVLDAPTIYLHKTLGGKMYAAEPVDGATIKRILDIRGRTPIAPDPAYQQILKGMAAVNYTTEDLIYKPRNVRTNRVYGFSPVEQIILTVNISIRRAIHKLQYYTEGNIPEALIGVPENWTPSQIEAFQENFDAMLEGNTAQRSKAKFIPGGTTPHFTKEEVMKDAFDEWLARIVCFAFGIDPTPFIHQVNRATAETARDVSLADGMGPLMDWVVSLCNMIIMKGFGYEDLRFDWLIEEAIDPMVKAQVNDIYLKAGVVLPDEVRKDIGKEPFTAEQKAEMDAKKQLMQQQLAGKSPEEDDQNDPSKTKAKVEPPVVKLGDIYVDVGATTVNARFDPPAPIQKVTKTVTAKRQPDGSMLGEVVEEGVDQEPITKSMKAVHNPDGSMSGHITETKE